MENSHLVQRSDQFRALHLGGCGPSLKEQSPEQWVPPASLQQPGREAAGGSPAQIWQRGPQGAPNRGTRDKPEGHPQ